MTMPIDCTKLSWSQVSAIEAEETLSNVLKTRRILHFLLPVMMELGDIVYYGEIAFAHFNCQKVIHHGYLT